MKNGKSLLQTLAPLMMVLPIDPALGAGAEDGYDLWLRYRLLDEPARSRLVPRARMLVIPERPSNTVLAAVAELHRGLSGLTGTAPALGENIEAGAVVLATPETMPGLAKMDLGLEALGAEGYRLRATTIDGHKVTLVAANTDRGLLYGAFAWLRAVRTGADLESLDVRSAPKLNVRILNHWDNLDRTVERGYAGESIWDWWALPGTIDPRYVDYARASASVGLNGAVLNNVNARIEIVTAPWIAKVAAVAGVLRPYGIKVHMAVRFSTPVELGELDTADPTEPRVLDWWSRKVDEIYQAIPDFGGFVVKANSEGQPGPHDYGRSHSDGANMLARALEKHGGIVMWRAFVYSQHDAEDRHKQAYTDFKPQDGKFAKNAIVQVKNGAIDFQPREPFHPMFGAMPKTPLFMEFQLAKEYLGFATHLAYLGPLFEEVLQDDTKQGGEGVTVAKVIDGRAHGQTLTGMAAVANTGSHRTWSGSHFDQANWYLFGRIAWDPDASTEAIAHEWVQQTFTTDPKTVAEIVAIMMGSREAVVDYMTPLGLHHLMATGHHYGPGPWVDNLKRPEWNPVYYHRATKEGIGFDRTAKGSNAVSQYAAPLAQRFSDPKTTPDNLLLWFHHLPWSYRMRSGRPLWDELVLRYDRGVAAVADMRRRWDALKPAIDARRHAEVATNLAIQEQEAQWWRDACVAYFQSISGRPLPAGSKAPPLTVEQYRKLTFPYAPGRGLPPRPYD